MPGEESGPYCRLRIGPAKLALGRWVMEYMKCGWGLFVAPLCVVCGDDHVASPLECVGDCLFARQRSTRLLSGVQADIPVNRAAAM